MMICHGWYPCFEPKKTPASLSHRVITQLLREEMNFEGLIMTDDLDMGAILNEYGLEETIRLAIAAGNDLAMICHRVPSINEVHGILEKLPTDQTHRALESVARFKKISRRRTNSPKPTSARSTTKSGTFAWQSSAKNSLRSAALKTANARRLRLISSSPFLLAQRE